ncbi:cysteine and glycine-rich protein [Plakobranchus ocellatus]|uniref:Cysteine and glycine-rich protein n=1 Tax=Plakobranchus ocellatus TaxID=259542 RepID=A0AAV3ZNU6_9GAST|nr:cysteine and glycine-rich protein [Plakobranchus ocellatus]
MVRKLKVAHNGYQRDLCDFNKIKIRDLDIQRTGRLDSGNLQITIMPWKPPVQVKCPKCGDSVYAAEEKLAGGHKFHKKCFKCDLCDKPLDSTTVTEHLAKLYCKQCHGRKFGPKGYGFGQGAGTLGMDSGERFGNNETEMSNVPTGNVLSGPGGANGAPAKPANGAPAKPASSAPAMGNQCGRCGKAVYHAEKAIGTNMPWHKSCFKCKDCNKSLDSSNMATHEYEIYCKGCHGKHFGPKGYGFGGGAGALSMHQ